MRRGQGGVRVLRREKEGERQPLACQPTLRTHTKQTQGKLNAADLKQRCSIFYKTLTPKDYKLLVGESGEITLKQLTKLLVQNELEDYDPVKEAFKVYDPGNTGYADPEILRNIFTSLDYGEITDEDLQVLIQAADVDGDGKISLEDFRGMLQINKDREE